MNGKELLQSMSEIENDLMILHMNFFIRFLHQ